MAFVPPTLRFFKWLYKACQQGFLSRKSKSKPKPVSLELFRLYVLLNTPNYNFLEGVVH